MHGHAWAEHITVQRLHQTLARLTFTQAAFALRVGTGLGGASAVESQEPLERKLSKTRCAATPAE